MTHLKLGQNSSLRKYPLLKVKFFEGLEVLRTSTAESSLESSPVFGAREIKFLYE